MSNGYMEYQPSGILTHEHTYGKQCQWDSEIQQFVDAAGRVCDLLNLGSPTGYADKDVFDLAKELFNLLLEHGGVIDPLTEVYDTLAFTEYPWTLTERDHGECVMLDCSKPARVILSWLRGSSITTQYYCIGHSVEVSCNRMQFFHQRVTVISAATGRIL